MYFSFFSITTIQPMNIAAIAAKRPPSSQRALRKVILGEITVLNWKDPTENSTAKRSSLAVDCDESRGLQQPQPRLPHARAR